MSGMFSIGIKNPLIKSINTIKNQAINMASCCVLVRVETKIPNPRVVNRKINDNAPKSKKLPCILILNMKMAHVITSINSRKVSNKNGMIFPNNN
jgi:hypothetical protein